MSYLTNSRTTYFFMVLITLVLCQAEPASAQLTCGDDCFTVCAEGCHYSTLQQAVDLADAGSKILIEPGIYSENVTINKSLTLAGHGWLPTDTVIDGDAAGSVFRVVHPDSATATVVTFANMTIAHGAASEGGGIYNSRGQVQLENCVVRNNWAGQRGGGIYSEDGVLLVSATAMEENSADRGNAQSAGGGMFVFGGQATVTQSLLSSNDSARGGALSNRGGQVILENASITFNGADLGGGLDNAEDSDLSIRFSTIAYNGVNHGHAGICPAEGGTATIENSIMVHNGLTGPGMPSQCEGELLSGGYNLIHAYPNWLNYTPLPEEEHLTNSFPVGLALLADNTGKTRTLALLPNSPAIDAIPSASCPSTDQRHIVRPQDGNHDGSANCDIGAFERSPWDGRGGDAPTFTQDAPLSYPAVWERERETLGYNPRFVPNTVTFDQDNRPVIRVGVHQEVRRHATRYPSRVLVDDSYIQTLAPTGEWIGRSLRRILRDTVEGWNGQIWSGTFLPEERVVFAGESDAYTVVRTSTGPYLLYSEDGMDTWTAYAMDPLRDGDTLVEPGSSETAPVVILGVKNKKLWAIFPEKNTQGGLQPLTYVDLAPESNVFLGPFHSGAGRKSAAVSNRTSIVFGSLDEACVTDSNGEVECHTEQWLVTYIHQDSPLILGPELLGSTPCPINARKCPDTHNGPAIVADQGSTADELHAVLGSHRSPFKYTKLGIDGWSTPESIGNQETYVSLVVDKNNVLHLVSRTKDTASRDRSLHYMRKEPGAPWQDRGKLVIPKPFDNLNKSRYGIWYHKLSVDRQGRLFLTYFYYTHDFTSAEGEAYLAKWPEEDINNDDYICTGKELDGDDKIDCKGEVNAHDPVVLMSDDGGTSWRLANTEDFRNGIEP